jgi:hypothetical protein
MPVRIRFPKLFPALLLLSLVQLPAANAQDIEPFKFFRDYVGLKEDQIAAIRNGKAVAKVVESPTPDEVFVFGSVYAQSTPEKYLKLASDIDALRKLPSYLAIRKFSDPPQLSDLDGFTLEADDIKQLKNCKPGECDVQLPTEAMDAFKQSVNWSAPDAPNQANQLTQKMALDAIQRYIQGGNAALGTYMDKRHPAVVGETFASLLAVRRLFPYIFQNWSTICSTIRKHNRKIFSPSSIGRKYSLDSNRPFGLCRPSSTETPVPRNRRMPLL